MVRWRLAGQPNYTYDMWDRLLLVPFRDEIILRLVNEKGNRHIDVTLTTDMAEAYANYILDAVKKQRRILERRREKKGGVE